jgi:hypothetical protein
MTATPDPGIPDDAPQISRLSATRLDFLRKTVAKDATNAEIGHFLELCSKYDLDPFAKEVWLAVSQSQQGKRNVLLMVGRDGLRKIAMRQGFVIDGDVVHAEDTFTVKRNANRTRTITHEYAEKDRGAVIGAWAEVYDGEGQQRGYFYAPLSEYIPKSEAKLKFSPWGSQLSVMTLAAAERTALGMATPLSGIVAQGELDAGEERRELGAGNGNGEAEGIDLGPEVEAVIAHATELGASRFADRATIEVELGDQPPEFVAEWVRKAWEYMAPIEGEAVADA